MNSNQDLAVPFAIFGLPLMFLMVTRQDSAPWLVAWGVYIFAFVLTYAAYEGYAYRTSSAVIFLRVFENLLAALVVAIVYAFFMSPDLAGMFAPRSPGG
jgi:hypothetical protein